MTRIWTPSALALAATLALAVVPVAQGAELPTVSSLMGLRTDTGAGWLAVLVPVPADSAVSGVMWYNNDGLTAFCGLLAATGLETGPGLVTEALEVAGPFTGESLAWSELTFTEPVAASVGRLYLVFAFPEGPGYVVDGAGGGPAIGYLNDAAGSRGWISGDGEAWSLLGAGYNFAVVPTFVAYEEGMVVKSLDGEATDEDAAPDVITEAYLTAGPNPFNPRIEIRFGLPAAIEVKLDVFDVRGLRVARLVDGPLAAGHHTVSWAGVDDRGRRVASGIYFARMQAGSKTLTRRVTLVK